MRLGRSYVDLTDRKPESWFAWRPVQLDNGQWAWLERVMRWKQHPTGWWHYSDISCG